MSLLIIKTAAGDSPEIRNAIEQLTAKAPEHRIIDTTAMRIEACRGCYACMLQTPGRCCIADDHAEVLKACLRYDYVVFIVDTALNFIDYRAKNVIDRLFPFVCILTRYHNGEVQHMPRYNKELRPALLYTGSIDRELVSSWMLRFEQNMNGRSLGAYPIAEAEEVCRCIS